MDNFKRSVLEAINHIILGNHDLALTIKEIAENAYGGINGVQKYYGLNSLDQKLERFLNYENGFFVELGANDGINQSNTLYFERHRNWTGILIEPTPHNFLSCRKFRSPDTKKFCNACVSFSYKERFVDIAYSNLMSTPLGLETDLDDPEGHAIEGKKFLLASEDIFHFGALAAPLNDLLIKGSAPRVIDLLSLDVEGAEIEVLKGIDHSQFRFKFMCIESRSFEKLKSYLSDHNYAFLEQLSVHDYLFRCSLSPAS